MPKMQQLTANFVQIIVQSKMLYYVTNVVFSLFLSKRHSELALVNKDVFVRVCDFCFNCLDLGQTFLFELLLSTRTTKATLDRNTALPEW